jgi:drug/metabolite transporter (DMT)-like permease
MTRVSGFGAEFAAGHEIEQTSVVFTRLIPFLFVLLWSSAFIASKTGLRDLSPLLFVAIRLALCAMVLLVSMAVRRES